MRESLLDTPPCLGKELSHGGWSRPISRQSAEDELQWRAFRSEFIRLPCNADCALSCAEPRGPWSIAWLVERKNKASVNLCWFATGLRHPGSDA